MLTDEWDREHIEGYYDGEFESTGSDEVPLKYLHIARETKAARLIVFEIDPDTLKPIEQWMPKSESALGSPHIIWVSRWLVEEKDLSTYLEE